MLGLTLLSATHDVAGDVFADWNPVELDSMVDGFGTFDFGLTDGVGEDSPAIAEPGETVVFILDISGAGVSAFDFIEANGAGYIAAAKFVNGPDDPENPGVEDSAFGATLIPEPGTAALLVFGLLGLGVSRLRA